MLVAATGFAPATFAAEATAAGAKRAIVLGRISDDPKKHHRALKPMADYLAARLRDLGIERGEVLMAKDAKQMGRYMREGRIDMLSETVFVVSQLRNEIGIEPLVKTWRKGASDYHTVFFVRKDSGINGLDDLRGRVIGFEEPRSTSAFLVPAAELITRRLKLAPLDSPREPAPAGEVGFVFTGEEINTTTLVYKRIIAAGAFSNLDWESEDDVPKAMRDEMKVIHQTRPLPRAVEAVRKDLSPALKGRIREILLRAHDDPAAKDVLVSYQKASRFSPFEADDWAGVEEARRLRLILRKHLD
jgi:phosphonate transport system substrate-binding protein